jgi:Zn-dependent protease
MGRSWKLGRIAGIDVFVHPTFLLVLFIRSPWPGIPAPLFWISVFGCVVLHEFGHALMARRFGIGTENITLYPIGGVARLRRLPRAPGAELLIALAGPAVNFAIVGTLMALGFLGLGPILTATGLEFLASFLEMLWSVNLILGLFNLIPAFPMDGGRVLRALLSGWLGRAQATTIAAGLGRLLAVLFGVSILWTVSETREWGDLWRLALPAFIYFAARIEEMQVLGEERRRRYAAAQSQGVWVAPPGYRWVQQGNGVWQLAPIVVPYNNPYRGPSSWS